MNVLNKNWAGWLFQACVTMEQKELLEEVAESVGAPAG